MTSARETYPFNLGHGDLARLEQYEGMVREIDQLRTELERCERLNEKLRRACDEATSENIGYRKIMRHMNPASR